MLLHLLFHLSTLLFAQESHKNNAGGGKVPVLVKGIKNNGSISGCFWLDRDNTELT